MRDRAFLGNQVGARNVLDRAFGQLEIEPVVVGDMHHQRAGTDAPQIVIDVVGFADAVAPDEVDRVIKLGAIGDAASGLLVRRVPIKHFGLHRREILRGTDSRNHSRSGQHRPAERNARAADAFPSGSL